MLKIGLTGGIGSGKSTAASIFERLGVPVFYADDESKQILNTDPQIISSLKSSYGDSIYKSGKVDRIELAKIVFNDAVALEKLNALVHPAIAERFRAWCKNQDAPYILKEAAILFEIGIYKELDLNILVTAPIPLRVKRVVERNGTTEEEVKARMQKQWLDNKKVALADFLIVNDEKQSLIKQILAIHENIIGQTS